MLRLLVVCAVLASAGCADAPRAAAHDAKADPAAGTLLLALSGGFALRPEPGLLEPGEVSLHQACMRLKQALAAPEKRLVLDCTGGFAPSFAGAEELAAILRARGPHRRVAMLIDGADDAALVVAAACDEVVAPEAGLQMVGGLELSTDYYAEALAKVGVKFAAVTSGAYKTAPEPFTRSGPSDAGAAEAKELADGLDAALTACARRGPLDADALRAARAKAPQPGPLAASLGLVDRAVEPGEWLAHQPEPTRWLDDAPGKPDLSSLPGLLRFWDSLLKGDDAGPKPARAVAVVELEGEITDDGESEPGSTIAGTDTAELIDGLADEERIVAVVVRMNSGGGSATASDRIHHAIRRLDAKKPVVALLDDVAASGGYYAACAARSVIAHHGTITGSIGVFALQPDLSGTRDLLGIHRHTVTTGPRADLMSSGPMTADKEAALRQIVEDTDQRFQGLVAERRHLAPERVRALAGGRVYTGQQALDAGLVDRLGTLADAVAAARAAAGVADPLPLETFPKRAGLAKRLDLLGVHAAERLVGDASWRMALHLAQARRPLVLAWCGARPGR